MRYFKAIKIEDMPLIQWASWANDEDELKQINDEEKKLILPEKDIPDFLFGVCPLDIVEGELVKRSRENMDDFEKKFLEQQKTATTLSIRNDLKTLFYELQFTKNILEDTEDLNTQFKKKLEEYNNSKAVE